MDDLKKENEKMAVLHTVMPSPDKNKDEYASYYILIEECNTFQVNAFIAYDVFFIRVDKQ
jgi:hypothetical protein